MKELLPDSRAKASKGEIDSPIGRMQPCYCANCGKDSGYCTVNLTHFFYLCDKCVQTYGQIAGTMMVPDEVFFQAAAEAQLEEHGRLLTPDELGKVLQEGASPLAKLLIQGR